MTNGSLGVNADHLLAGLGGFLLDGMVAQPCADALRQADDLARAAPELLAEGKLGERIEKCPALDMGALRGRELSHGKMLLGFLAQAYVWELDQLGRGAPRLVVPQTIARALVELAGRIDEPPIYNYADYVLRNSTLRTANDRPQDIGVGSTKEGPGEESNLDGHDRDFSQHSKSLVMIKNL
jgi:hypothetical protein